MESLEGQDRHKLLVARRLRMKDAALRVYSAIQGDACDELTSYGPNLFYDENGVDHIVEALSTYKEAAVVTRTKAMKHYERVGRMQGESLLKYLVRFERTERKLRAVGLAPHEGDTRAFKLLQPARLDKHSRQNIMTCA